MNVKLISVVLALYVSAPNATETSQPREPVEEVPIHPQESLDETLLDFLGVWETAEGEWLDPTEFDIEPGQSPTEAEADEID